MKNIKVETKTHERLEMLAAHHGISIKNLADTAVNFACENFEKNGLSLPPIECQSVDREALDAVCISESEKGIESFESWVKTLSAAEEYAIRSEIRHGKKQALEATKEETRRILANY